MKWALHIEILLLYVVTCQEYGIQVTNDNIKQFLSRTEWELLVGPGSEADFEIIHPVLYRPESSSKYEQTISINALGQSWLSELIPSNSIVATEFALLRRSENGTEDVTNEHRDEFDCLYYGNEIAVSTCDGIRGVISGKGSEYFTIHPLPKRLQNHSSDTQAHMISRRVLTNHDGLGTQRDEIKMDLISDLASSKNSVETSAEIDKKYQEEHLIDGDSNDAPKASGTFQEITVQRDLWNEKSVFRYKRGISELRRTDRGTGSSPVFVETAVFVDRDLYHHMARNYPQNTERELVRFVLAMINAVQLLYHDSSLGQIVNFVLKRLEILHVEPAGLNRPHDIDKYLSSFCQWQGRENPGTDQDTRHWDHALMLTGLDLYVVNKRGKVSSQVVGLAPVAGMCTKTSSCTVNEGRHFESVYVVAHEIGHNLGMRHDGSTSDNQCDPTSYIMSPTLGSGKITWSPCSRSYLQRFLQTSQSRCLLDHGSSGGQLDHSAEGALPGERFDSNQQCILKYGFGSRHSTQQPLDDICRDMHCERERYTWTSHPALEGTFCGNNKWCRGGRCIDKNGLSTYGSSTEKISGVWSAWHISECASGCLYDEHGNLDGGSTGIRVITRSCNTLSSLSEESKCVGPRKRYVACRAGQCLKVPSTTINEFADQICTRARDVDVDLLGTGLQRISSNVEEACTVWCPTNKGGFKTRGWTFPDGTACQTRKYQFHKTSYCITGRCEEFLCSGSENDQFLDLPERCHSLNTNHIDRNDDIDLLSKNLNIDRSDNWMSASGCHFNCIAPGIGIRLVNRLRMKANETSIQLCDPDSNSCGRLSSPYQFATSICSKYKERVRRLSGLGMQISPSIEDPDRPCHVACQDDTVSHRFYLVNGENGWFPFGTACSKGNVKSFCVTGKCLEFGKDDTPLYESILSLPLLSRYKRMSNRRLSSGPGQNDRTLSWHKSVKGDSRGRYRRNLKYDKTVIISKLKQKDIDSIILQLNFSGQFNYQQYRPPFQIDLNNPIHIPMDQFDYRMYNSA
ncbi:A disintegrin and metalloproteinase with thrombospondin motifs adt-1-like isoform X1 [Diprion similis]|uniref:A disintegrin and metalloproteinase with thrombospondin motifs adt-1-like isoform X1 n=1 Tax=Diprion similis TaxID=362088 RepID=UPI001EF8D20D|nr:A disintegrin and metalloproteinase with thrombospondin motifs adt-1-like isoform X1 [Diprion similis]